jgi:L-lysine exporter family protein LysE/ArgO
VVVDAQSLTLGRSLAATAAFTFLNPHVYLDTVLLMGAADRASPPNCARSS